MYVEEEVEAAVYCMRKDFGHKIDDEMIDEVVASIRRRHREARNRAISEFFSKAGDGVRRLIAHPRALISRHS